MIDENYEELCEVRDQITGANFDGKDTEILNDLLADAIHLHIHNEDNESVEELVHDVYEELQRRVRE